MFLTSKFFELANIMLLQRVKHVLKKITYQRHYKLSLLEQVLYNCENNIAKHFV